MRIILFLLFVSVFFGSTGYYLYRKMRHTFADTFLSSKWFIGVYIFILVSFIAGKILEGYSLNFFSEALVKFGSYSIGFLFYALLFALFFDLIRLINYMLPFYPPIIKNNLGQLRLYIGTGVVFVIIALVSYGIINAFKPRVNTVELRIEKEVQGLKNLNVVAISDIHLGTMVNKRKTKKLIQEVNKLKPDLVLIAGDIIDDNIKAVKHYGLMEYFNEIQPKYGMFGIMGNHEYIGRSYTDIPYYTDNNINMLIDSTALIDNKFYIIGRDDLQAKTMMNKDRSQMVDLVEGLDSSKPLILLDHQPYGLDKSDELGIDLHFSGHTHHGQFWPLSFITGKLFENDWGYLQKGLTHYYVSCGYGTAGPPIRIGSYPEIVNFKIEFK